MPLPCKGDERMKIERFQGGSADSLETSQSNYYQKGYNYGLKMIQKLNGLVIDPFSRNCQWADLTNDLNKETKAKYNLDAIEFLEMILKKYGENSVKCILFDPPFSSRKSDVYQKSSKEELINIYATSGYVKKFFKIAEKLIMPEGIIIKLGYNSSKPIKGYEMKNLMVVNFGANRNDVLLTIWQNPNKNLKEWIE